MRAGRAGRARASRRAGRHGLLERSRKDRRALQAAAAGARRRGLALPEIAVFSGDTVRKDAEGFLYFIGRRDEMIKTSGYRVSPTEVEEVLYAHADWSPNARPSASTHSGARARRSWSSRRRAAGRADRHAPRCWPHCRNALPAYMVPARIDVARRPAAAQSERQDRPQAAVDRMDRQPAPPRADAHEHDPARNHARSAPRHAPMSQFAVGRRARRRRHAARRCWPSASAGRRSTPTTARAAEPRVGAVARRAAAGDQACTTR